MVFCAWLISLSVTFLHVAYTNRLSLLIAKQYSIEWVLVCILFIHFVDIWIVSTLGLLWIKLIWTFAAGLCVVFVFSSLGKIPTVESLGHMVNLCLILKKKTPNCFPKWSHHFAIPPGVYKGSNFSTSSPTLVIIRLSDYSHSSKCKAASHWVFCLYFPNDSVLVAQSCPTLKLHRLYPVRFLCPWDSPGKNTEVGNHVLLQGIFPTQGSNMGLLNQSQILYLTSDVEHLFMSYLTICKSSLVKWLYKSFLPLKCIFLLF